MRFVAKLSNKKEALIKFLRSAYKDNGEKCRIFSVHGRIIIMKLFIAVDPGFDSMKVVANGKAFKFPFNVIETDERKMNDYRLRDDFMLLQKCDGSTYRVGQYAREQLYDNKEKIDSFYTEQRFISDEFQVGLDTAIALAIEKNELYEDQANLEIYLIVALPHACRNTYSTTITGAAAGPHSFQLRCGRGETKQYTFTIAESHIHTVSQTIAAILGETSDDNGDINEEKFCYLSNGPTLVLDGGYYTMGMVVVSRGGTIDEDKTESDTRHAMANVNEAVAAALRDKRPDVNHYSVEYLLSKDGGTIRYLENGKAVKVNVGDIREEKMQEVCADLIEYLNQKYNHLLDFKYVLVTGGTGFNFYPQILKYYEEANLLDRNHLLLTSGELEGRNNPIEFAIAIGAYKGLKAIANS